MMTFRQFAAVPPSLPMRTGWYLTELGEACGRQDLFTRQAPQKLRALREHALIESAVSSNRIEGVEVDQSRVATLMFGKPALEDRDEEEVRGYRLALDLIHGQGANLALTELTIKRLHKLCRGEIWDAGAYKEQDIDIIQTYPGGGSRVRFRPVPAKQTPAAMKELTSLWKQARIERWAPPLLLTAMLNLDFLCVHPFRDGNGRVSRLLFLLGCYHAGLEVGRYISLERLIEQNKDRYYEVLEASSQNWHKGRHDPWPTLNFLLFILTLACREFEERVGSLKAPRGEKTGLVEAAIGRRDEPFTVAELQADCPGVSVDLIRKILARLRGSRVECLGRGRSARWRRVN